MKFVQILLIFTAIVGWSCGEQSLKKSQNNAINRKLSRTFGRYMDTDAKPCSDFYQYACGKWAEEHENEKHLYKSAPAMVNHLVDMDFIWYMDNTDMSGAPEFVKKAYELYTSCTDIEDYNELFYMNWLQEHENMTWALMSSSEEADAAFSWVHTLGIMRRYGMHDVFLDETMSTRGDDLSKNYMSLDKPYNFVSLTYEDMKVLNKTVILPSDCNPLEVWWKEISEFEELLVQLMDVEDDDGLDMFSAEKLPLPWLNKFMAIALQETSLDSSMKLTIENIPYLEALDALLKEYDDKFVCRYLELRFLWHLNKVPSDFTEGLCMQYARAAFPPVFDWIYGQLYPELEQDMSSIDQMFGNIVRHINATLSTDKRGVIPEYFMSKLDTMKIKIGNFPRIDTIKVLDSQYSSLVLNSGDFYGNQLKLAAFEFAIIHKITTNELDIDNIDEYYNMLHSYDMGVDFDPGFKKPQNVLTVPLVLLKQPFYHWGYNHVYKYSILGSVLANYVYQELYLDGFTDTEMKTLSNVGSLHTAFEAFFSSQPTDSAEDLSYLEDTLQKLFFLNAAQWYCEADATKNPLNEIVSHLPEFTESFDCKMNTFLEIFAHLSSN